MLAVEADGIDVDAVDLDHQVHEPLPALVDGRTQERQPGSHTLPLPQSPGGGGRRPEERQRLGNYRTKKDVGLQRHFNVKRTARAVFEQLTGSRQRE